MGIIKNLSRLGALLASLSVIAVGFASAASASTAMIPVPGPPDTGSGTAGVIVVHTVAGGMPGWQIAAIAIAAALVAAVAAVLVDRILEGRRRLLATPA
jgi:MFS family permease